MDKIVADLLKNDSFIVSVVTMFVGSIASYVAVLPKRKGQIIGNIALAVVFDIFTFVYYRNTATTVATVILSVLWVALCLMLSKNRELISRKRLDSMIRKFTDKADYSEPLCIFGGDLDFFGNVARTLTSLQQKEWYRKNSVTQCNKQLLQLKKMKFRNIQILSLRPNESEARIRIGYLKTTLRDAVTIKFIEEKDCDECDERSTCLACDVCNDCTQNKDCNRTTTHTCEKLLKYNKYRCFNPDTKLRGRIAKLKGTGSTTVAIVTTHTPGKSYLLKEYSSNTKECTIYQNIWGVWWKKCKEDHDLINKCVKEYEEFINAGESTQ